MAKQKKQCNYCKRCEHLKYDGYETNDRICEVFGYDVPEEYWLDEDDDEEYGCTCSEEQLKQFIEAENEAWLEHARGFTHFMETGEIIEGAT